MDTRHRWFSKRVALEFGVDAKEVDAAIDKSEVLALFAEFFAVGSANVKLLFYRQPRDIMGDEGVMVPGNGPAEIFVTMGEMEKLTHKAVYFVKLTLSS